MRLAGRAVIVAAMCAAVVMSLEARGPGDEADVQFQVATLFYDETRFHESREAYRLAG